MAYKVEVAPLANKDLEEILDYILRELSNPSDAADLLDGIGSCYSNLEKMPEMYERCRDTRLLIWNTHPTYTVFPHRLSSP